ncbi:PleD family two-component system response regulator [Oceanicola sp. 502str15]|uniref:response regulator n=1 Tax=Oceanicola sp. 502str15 TaxID=2696061 RepID=UPI0020952C55|nr:response regulator [Oceanicola sp. 502str15]MCO6384639.1 response regulator [Oceanicola sp. 502str15]
MQILAVDDDTTFLQLLKSVLTHAGYDQVETACDADSAEARIAAAKEPYDCILLDIQMPGTCGIELCARIRKLPDYAITPILMLTALLDEASIDRAFNAGASDYVTKPIKGLELGARIRTARLLAEQTRKSLGLERSEAQLSARLDKLMQVPVSEAVEIEGVPACVSQRDLEHLLSLLPEKILAIASFALRVEDIAEMNGAMTRDAFSGFLAEVAGTISHKLTPSQHYITYVGDGIFGCVVLGSGCRSFDLKADEPDFWNTRTEAMGGSPRNVRLRVNAAEGMEPETGKDCVDSLRSAIAGASEDGLMNRLQQKLDHSRAKEGVIVPRRPRLGITRRVARQHSEPTLDTN